MIVVLVYLYVCFDVSDCVCVLLCVFVCCVCGDDGCWDGGVCVFFVMCVCVSDRVFGCVYVWVGVNLYVCRYVCVCLVV